MRAIFIVSRAEDWPSPPPGLEVISARDYISPKADSERPAKAASAKSREAVSIVNLSKSYRYQSFGYYVSLLASARGHKVVPAVSSTQDVRSRGWLRWVSEEVEEQASKAFAGMAEPKVTVASYFGRPTDERFERLTRKLFGLLEIPVLRATFAKTEDGWELMSAGSPREIAEAEKPRIMELALEFLTKGAAKKRPRSYRYDLAILHDPNAQDAPSNKGALQKLQKVAEDLDLSAELIEKEDYGRIAEYDALFIRETTYVNHHTYRFARKAAAEGLVVIDDPESILKCTNKVFLAELLTRHGLPHPETRILDRDTLESGTQELRYPCILKRPDGSFSAGVYKVDSAKELDALGPNMLKESDLIVAQEFLPTPFDWRIGVLGGRPLFACKYFMAKAHWQIIKREGGRERVGDHETVRIESVPRAVVETAVTASRLVGDGFYGVDLKEIDGKAYVIEVNDNPNLDAGVEDQVLGDLLYQQVMRHFLDCIEAKKARRSPRF